MSCGGWDAVNPLCRAGQLVDKVTSHVGNDIFGSIADYFAGVAQSVMTWLWQQVNAATSIDLTSPGIKSDLIATASIAGLITFGLFLIQIIASVLRQDSGGLGRAVRGLGISFIGAAFAVASTQILLAAVDGLSNAVTEFAFGTGIEGLGKKMVTTSMLSKIGNPAGLLLLSLVLIFAAVGVWVALMIRKMLIIVSAVFAPLAFSGASSDITRSWVRRWIEFTLALIFSKLILVIILMIGVSVLEGAGQGAHHTAGSSITTLVIGALTLLLAAFAPWMAIKMVHFAGESFHAVHSQAAGATTGARSAVAVPQKVASVARPLVGAFAGGAGGAAAGALAGRGAAQATGSQAKSMSPSSTGSGTVTAEPVTGSVASSGPGATQGRGISSTREPARAAVAPPQSAQPPSGGSE